MIINWPWGTIATIKCKDGSIRRIYRNLNDAVPLFIHGWKSDISADVKGTEKLSAAAKVKYEKEIQGLMFGLNEQNQSLMMSFRTVYLAFSSNPCGTDGFFQRQIESLLDEQRKISALKIKINALIELASINNPDTISITRIFGEIAAGLGGPASAPAAALEIKDAREAAQKLIAEAKQ